MAWNGERSCGLSLCFLAQATEHSIVARPVWNETRVFLRQGCGKRRQANRQDLGELGKPGKASTSSRPGLAFQGYSFTWDRRGVDRRGLDGERGSRQGEARDGEG